MYNEKIISIYKSTHVICPSRVILLQQRNYQRMEHLQQTYQATITWVQLSPGKMSCTFLMCLIFEYLSPWSEKILALSFLWVNFVTSINFCQKLIAFKIHFWLSLLTRYILLSCFKQVAPFKLSYMCINIFWNLADFFLINLNRPKQALFCNGTR